MSNINETSLTCKVKMLFSKSEKPAESPTGLLNKIKANQVLKNMADGKATLHSKYQEGLSEKGAKAMALLQEGLIMLGLLKVGDIKDKNPECWWTDFKWGLYGDKTIAAVRTLQEKAGIKSQDRGMETEPNGQRFGKDTLECLRQALQARAQGKDWRAALKNRN